ncbi:MAG: hypothetical protein SOT81_10050 [Treponema sp.]|nr:hypothetical protein [Treponema sp.]
MKKLIAGLASLVSMAVFADFAFASGVENKTNLSTGYLRNPSRNTENERPEAAFYNIAGTAFLKDGLWIGGGNQFVFKEYSNKLDTNNAYSAFGISDYKSTDDTTVWLYPDLNAVYKKGRWAIFSNFGVYAGGGSLSYDEGTSATTLLFLNGARNLQKEAAEAGLAASAAQTLLQSGDSAVYAATGLTSAQLKEYASAWSTESTEKVGAAEASLAMAKDHSLDVTSITYGIQLGAAYLVTDWLSLSAAYRYTIGTQDMTLKCNDTTFKAINGSNKISYDAVGYGQSMVFGIHAKPPVVPKLDLSLQYQTLSRIEYNVDNVKGNIAQYYDITNDKNFRTDLPAVLNLGAGYHVLDNLYVSTSFNYYFNDFAHQDSILSETDYDNSWEIALGVDYRFCKYVGASIGASYGNQGTTDTSNSTFNPVLDNIVVGGGFEIYPTDQLTVSLSCLYANYFNTDYYLGSKTSSTKTVLSKDVVNAGIGVTYHFN